MKKKPKHRILVVEDDRTSRKLLIQILDEAGYEVIDCGEGRDAIHLAQMSDPLVMVIDVMLPDMRGTAIVEELENFPKCRFIKSIFLTGILAKKGAGSNCLFEIEGKKYKALAKPVLKSQLLKLLKATVAESLAEKEEFKIQEEIKEQEIRRETEIRREREAAKKKAATEEVEAPWYEAGEEVEQPTL